MSNKKDSSVKATVIKKSKFNPEFGFDPQTPVKDIAKHYAKVIAEKKLADITVNTSYVIAMKIPVWPSRIDGSPISYYKDPKTGKWKYSFKSGIILKTGDDLAFNNVPKGTNFSADDFDDHPFQFLVIASDSEKILPGTIAHTRPEVKSMGFFNHNGVELVMLITNSIMFTKEV